jgi:hypothetical protein
MEISKKRTGFGLEVKTIQGTKGTYLFFLTKDGSYHTFLEVSAKDAARDCNAKENTSDGRPKNTRAMCKELWERN